jgi:uncharacterized membrane protein YfcA
MSAGAGWPATAGVLADGPVGLAVLAAAATLAGAINSVAGGGTILTFPLLGFILPPDPGRLVTANATSTLGLWPASLAASWAYRDAGARQPAWARWLLLPSAVGAAVGVILVLALPDRWFAGAVPWLILLAAVLFAAQPRLASWTARPATGVARDAATVTGGGPTIGRIVAACGLQFVVAVYGGYFGAGIGILMLAVLGMLDLGDIHQLNAAKNVLATVVNGTAATAFIVGAAVGLHDVSWLHVAVMAGASIVGSLGAARFARRLPAAVVRRAVSLIGFALAAYYFLPRG